MFLRYTRNIPAVMRKWSIEIGVSQNHNMLVSDNTYLHSLHYLHQTQTKNNYTILIDKFKHVHK